MKQKIWRFKTVNNLTLEHVNFANWGPDHVSHVSHATHPAHATHSHVLSTSGTRDCKLKSRHVLCPSKKVMWKRLRKHAISQKEHHPIMCELFYLRAWFMNPTAVLAVGMAHLRKKTTNHYWHLTSNNIWEVLIFFHSLKHFFHFCLMFTPDYKPPWLFNWGVPL